MNEVEVGLIDGTMKVPIEKINKFNTLHNQYEDGAWLSPGEPCYIPIRKRMFEIALEVDEVLTHSNDAKVLMGMSEEHFQVLLRLSDYLEYENYQWFVNIDYSKKLNRPMQKVNQ